jgi:predicted nucleic acid-binding protein
VILIDTSAWVEFLRDTGSVISARVDAELDGDIAICDAIRMEVLAGARDESHLEALRGLLVRASVLPTEPAHYDEAARLYRRCRREGETVRRLIDCLIAAVAIGAGVLSDLQCCRVGSLLREQFVQDEPMPSTTARMLARFLIGASARNRRPSSSA